MSAHFIASDNERYPYPRELVVSNTRIRLVSVSSEGTYLNILGRSMTDYGNRCIRRRIPKKCTLIYLYVSFEYEKGRKTESRTQRLVSFRSSRRLIIMESLHQLGQWTSSPTRYVRHPPSCFHRLPISNTPPLILRAPYHLHDTRPNPSSNQSFPPFPQSSSHLHQTPIPALLILVAAPQHLRRGSRSQPHDCIEVDGIGEFRPDVDFAAEDEVVRGRGYVCG